MRSLSVDCEVCPGDSQDIPLARDYAADFQLPLTPDRSDVSAAFYLDVRAGGIGLRETESNRLVADDQPPKLFHVSRRDPLGRAVAPALSGQSAGQEVVIDATAGLGADAVTLAMMGYRVIAVERHPVIAALLRARLGNLAARVASRIEFVFADACVYLKGIAAQCSATAQRTAAVIDPRVVYLDPMYPPSRKSSALPPLAMQALRRIVGPDDNAGALFKAGYAATTRRLVVKRPRLAEPIAPNPDGCHRGKLARYDVYVKTAPELDREVVDDSSRR